MRLDYTPQPIDLRVVPQPHDRLINSRENWRKKLTPIAYDENWIQSQQNSIVDIQGLPEDLIIYRSHLHQRI